MASLGGWAAAGGRRISRRPPSPGEKRRKAAAALDKPQRLAGSLAGRLAGRSGEQPAVALDKPHAPGGDSGGEKRRSPEDAPDKPLCLAGKPGGGKRKPSFYHLPRRPVLASVEDEIRLQPGWDLPGHVLAAPASALCGWKGVLAPRGAAGAAVL